MSNAIIWFDRKNADPGKAANGVPAAVIGRMKDEPQNQRTHLQHIRKRPEDVLSHIELSPDYALFIRGTTSDIVEALSADMAYGIQHVGVVNDDRLHIRYFRHKAGLTKTVSYIGIAGGQYWGAVPVADTADEARRQGIWAHMAQGNIHEDYKAWDLARKNGATGVPAPLLVTSIGLRILTAIIRSRQGVDAWI